MRLGCGLVVVRLRFACGSGAVEGQRSQTAARKKSRLVYDAYRSFPISCRVNRKSLFVDGRYVNECYIIDYLLKCTCSHFGFNIVVKFSTF